MARWDDLRVFLAVARAESLSGAGKVLRVDPATVGRRIAQLEQQVDAALFTKSPQGYAITTAGQRLLEHAIRAEQAVGEAFSDVAGDAGGLTGAIRIGAPDGCANYLLPQVCAEICAAHPGLEVQIIALPRVFNLSKREADMAITVSPPSAGRLTVQKLSAYHLHLAASREYLAEHPPIRTLADVKGHRIVGYIPDMIFDKELDYLSEAGADHVTLGSNSVSVQFNWVRTGGGLGVVHDFAIPAAPNVTKILTDEISLTRNFYLVRHMDDRRVERLNRFAELLAQGIRGEIARLEANS
ncbi:MULTISPECIES: LysR family transcriptional regulator [Halocynthiibacter]|uniref:LysR family transcriptional regulator n=1 Tax=Halocynthiibacter halioticoli TaxID=2986804 RepID=A0AAE3LUH0_9RHOB|nr:MULTISPECIES: LysR family transcriptional regulator [Halocynthiibacter]MCV6824145.1 LysR family transcriptional regulator [Halocynthiibacter halioticoli]MCW4057146.1 LysR family transcriptional regulator [Halocynthiibacter sp. SDUM655004]MDE0589824.1 LysR family transcriptional regulator [Halocynthiibacter sp. C4]